MADVDTVSRVKQAAGDAIAAIDAASDLAALEQLRIKYLARNGEITLLSRGIGKAPPDQRAAMGAAVNEANRSVNAAFDAKKAALEASAGPRPARGGIDISLPGIRRPVGRRHPLSQVDEEIKSILIGLGF